MDPCSFLRIVIGKLALRFGDASRRVSSDYGCKIKLNNFPPQFTTIPSILTHQIENQFQSCFAFSRSDLEKLKKPLCLKIEIYKGLEGRSCGLSGGGKLLGSVWVPLDLKGVENRGCVFQKGWVDVCGSGGGSRKVPTTELHLDVRAEPDPRFVFEFGGEPECSPQVLLVNDNNVRQPVFTCTFSFRNTADRSSTEEPSTSTNWLSSFRVDKKRVVRERKGWTITIHDLSGSPVAAASMVTPFVPLPGTDYVSRANPGAWLILRPGYGSWKPWGRLEAWKERRHLLGYRFDLIPDGSIDSIALGSSTISSKNGGKFTIDIATDGGASPACTPNSSFDLGSWYGSSSDQGSGSWAHLFYRGFVMSSTVAGDGKKCSKPVVEIGAQHVTCTEDAAAFVALSAAIDLSTDACGLFSGRKLRKELRQSGQE